MATWSCTLATHGDAGVHAVKSGGYPADDTKADNHGNLIVHAGDAKADAGVHAVIEGTLDRRPERRHADGRVDNRWSDNHRERRSLERRYTDGHWSDEHRPTVQYDPSRKTGEVKIQEDG